MPVFLLQLEVQWNCLQKNCCMVPPEHCNIAVRKRFHQFICERAFCRIFCHINSFFKPFYLQKASSSLYSTFCISWAITTRSPFGYKHCQRPSSINDDATTSSITNDGSATTILPITARIIYINKHYLRQLIVFLKERKCASLFKRLYNILENICNDVCSWRFFKVNVFFVSNLHIREMEAHLLLMQFRRVRQILTIRLF